MNRTTRWILAVIGIVLAACSLFIIYISKKPISAPSNIIACIGFVIGFLILMILLYSLSIRVGIVYTLLLLLFFLIFFVDWDAAKKFAKQQMDKMQGQTLSEQQEEAAIQPDKDGSIVIEHPYDDLISLQWGTLNEVDMDLILIDRKDNVTISYHNQQHSLDEENSVWLDYDYQKQNHIAQKEVITILGMQDRTFSVLVVNYNGQTLNQDAIVVITLADGKTETFVLPAQRFNDATDGVYVCDIIAQSSEIVEVMEDFSESETNYR